MYWFAISSLTFRHQTSNRLGWIALQGTRILFISRLSTSVAANIRLLFGLISSKPRDRIIDSILSKPTAVVYYIVSSTHLFNVNIMLIWPGHNLRLPRLPPHIILLGILVWERKGCCANKENISQWFNVEIMHIYAIVTIFLPFPGPRVLYIIVIDS